MVLLEKQKTLPAELAEKTDEVQNYS